MFSTITSLNPHLGRAARATNAHVRSPRTLRAAQTANEADEMQLLVQVARWNDETAFEEIIARHRTAVTRAALQITRDAGSAEDIAQQTFTALWTRADRLVDKSIRLRPWLTTVARNAAIENLRAQRPSASLAQVAQIPSSAPSPEDTAIAAESRAYVARALATLPAAERAAIECVYVADMTLRSAADALGEPITTIESRVRSALGRLSKLLESADY